MHLDPESLLVIVVGARLEAEVIDRPLAYQLRDIMLDWQEVHECDEDDLHAVVCSDLWYLNASDLMLQPTITIGDPEMNAATAYYANRMETALVVDDTFRIQLDPEFIDLKACVWGVSPSATTSALEAFVERYLDGFLRSAHNMRPAE